MEKMDREGELQLKIRRFLRSRRTADTKDYVYSIIEVLERRRKEDSERKIKKSDVGWVRVKELLDDLVGTDKKIKSETPLYRLLNDLAREMIIERRVVPMPEERMRPGTFYRTAEQYQLWWFLSREELEKQYAKSQIVLTELMRQFVIARDLLEDGGFADPQQKIAENYKLLYNREPLNNFKVIQPPKEKEKFRRPMVWVDTGLIMVRRKQGLRYPLENKSEQKPTANQ